VTAAAGWDVTWLSTSIGQWTGCLTSYLLPSLTLKLLLDTSLDAISFAHSSYHAAL
jgi:hypothetical protein